MAKIGATPRCLQDGGSSAGGSGGHSATRKDQSMASEWLEALTTVQNNEVDASNLGDFFANRDGRGAADGAADGAMAGDKTDAEDLCGGAGSGGGARGGVTGQSAHVQSVHGQSEDEVNNGRMSGMKKASFPDTDGISSLLTKQQQAAKNRAVSASRKRRSRWILSRDGSQTGRESHAAWNNSALDSRGGDDDGIWYSEKSSGSSDDESLDDLEQFQIMKSGVDRHYGGMIRGSDWDRDGLRLDQSTTLLQLQRHENIRDAQRFLAHANNSSIIPRRYHLPSPPPQSPLPSRNNSKNKNKQQRRNRYQMHQFARNNDEREHGSRQLYDAYADTVATESKLRAITLHEEETLRKGLVQDLQNQLNLHLSAANACLAGAVSAAVGEGEEEKYAGVMQALQSIATAQKRQHDLSQQFRELRNRLDDVLTNATPHPGSLNNERGKRRRARDRLRQQLRTMLERQQEDRSQVRALKETAKHMRLQIRDQQDEMEKVRTVWNLATDGLPPSRSATPVISRYAGRSSRMLSDTTRAAAAAATATVMTTMTTKTAANMEQKRGRAKSRTRNRSRSPSRTGMRGTSRASTVRSEAGSPLHVTARDLETGSPSHVSAMQSRLFVNQSAENDDSGGGEDEEELEWKEFEIQNGTNVGSSVMPQEYVDAQFGVRLLACQTGFREIEKELQQAVRCDVCSKVITNPRITRACSHVMCFRCLGTKRPGANAADVSKKDASKKKGGGDSHIVCPVCGTVTEARSDGIMSLLQAKLVPFNAAANTRQVGK